MADNTALNSMTGGDNIATDDLTTLNGGAVSGVKVQRVKVGYGVDGTHTDVSTTNGLPIQGITAASSSTSWTSATSVNTANTIAVGGMNAVSVTLIPTTTFTGGVLTFEVSPDGTNWVPISMARIDSYTTESVYTIVASTNRGWTTSVDGFADFRVRLSTAITGTGTATVIVIPQAFSVEPMVTVGQSTASQLQANVYQQGPPAEPATVGTALGALNAVTAIDARGANFVVFNFAGTYSLNITFQLLNDNSTTWTSAAYLQLDSTGSFGGTQSGAVNPNVQSTYYVPTYGVSQVRVTVSSYTSGSITVTGRPTTEQIGANTFYANLIGDAQFSSTVGRSIPYSFSTPVIYNGASFDRARAATTTNGTTGTGVPAAGILGFDGTNYRRIVTDTTGNIIPTATTGTITSVTSAAASTTILASNTSRKSASVYNDSTSILYLSLSATAASTTTYSVQIQPGGYYELPNTRLYTGQLTGIWSAANGFARVTENT